MTIRGALPGDRKTWDRLASHPLQSWAWGDFRSAMGVDVVRLLREEHHTPREAWQLTFHRLPFFPYTIGYFPKGPYPSPAMVTALRTTARTKRAVSIQLEPDVRSDGMDGMPTGLLHAHHPLFTRYTFVLNLTRSEEDLQAAMHPKTRYNIRVAARHGVTVQEDNSPAAFRTYLRLNEETLTRQGFYAHNPHYQKTMWNVLSKAGIARLWVASYKNRTLAAWILFVWKDTIYYPYGASSRDHRNVMAPTLLLWEIARWAKHQGLKAFDLWGALGPEPDEQDPWYGFHKFKQGFGPDLVEFAGSYDLVTRPLLYRAYTAADRLRWAWLNRKR